MRETSVRSRRAASSAATVPKTLSSAAMLRASDRFSSIADRAAASKTSWLKTFANGKAFSPLADSYTISTVVFMFDLVPTYKGLKSIIWEDSPLKSIHEASKLLNPWMIWFRLSFAILLDFQIGIPSYGLKLLGIQIHALPGLGLRHPKAVVKSEESVLVQRQL